MSSGGTAAIHFALDTLGKTVEVKIIKSVEFAFDQKCMRVISLAKDWIPASEKEKKLKAYRQLPISYTKNR